MSETTNDEPREGEREGEPVNPQAPAAEQGLTSGATGQPPDSAPRDEGDDDESESG